MGTKLSAQETQAVDAILTRLDHQSKYIQANHKAWGMPFEAALALVKDLDKTADDVEIASFGLESFTRRQNEVVVAAAAARQARQAAAAAAPPAAPAPKTAQVLQHDADEAYMNTFSNPQAPVMTNADEPYMAAYKDDQSSGVIHGTSTVGKPLAPGHK